MSLERKKELGPGTKGFGPRTKGLDPGKGFASRGSGLRSYPPAHRARSPRPATPQQDRRRLQLATFDDLRAVALLRDGGVCVGCGKGGALDCHHRINKGMGGSPLLDRLDNLVSLCGPGNAAGCHGWAHTWKTTRALGPGLSVPDCPPGQDLGEWLAQWPVRYSSGGVWRLDVEGDLHAVA